MFRHELSLKRKKTAYMWKEIGKINYILQIANKKESDLFRHIN